ncbi:MAG: hypothetical protein ABIQ99_12085 [Thermoflexales bacterium]
MQTAQKTRTIVEADAALTLTADQQRALLGLMAQLDRTHGVPGPHMLTLFGRARDIEEVLRVAAPDGPRKPRTAEHRKVLSAYIDAANLPPYLRPWQYLVFELLETLAESALASEKPAITGLRSELLKLTRLQEDADRAPGNESAAADVARATSAFVKRFRAALPSMILNTVSLANSVILFVIDNTHRAAAADTAQLLEASRYFLSAPSCGVLVCGDEMLLLERLSHSGAGVDGRGILRGWQTGRIDIGAVVAQPSFRGQPTPAPAKATPSREPARARAENSLARRDGQSVPVLLPMIAVAAVFLIDQASKLGVIGSPRAGMAGGLALGVELLGLALAALMWMWSPESEGRRRIGYALIAGGLASSLFDGVLRGATLTTIRLGGLPGFSLAHIALLAGIVVIVVGLLRPAAPGKA